MTPHFWPKNDKNARGDTSRKIGWGCAARFLKPLPYFRLKSVIFPTLFQTWSKFDTLFPEALKPGAWPERPTSCYGTYTVFSVNIKREIVLSPNDEEVTNSSKNHTKFKTRVHKPYPISDQNGRNWYPISDPWGAKNALQIMSLIAYASETNNCLSVSFLTILFRFLSSQVVESQQTVIFLKDVNLDATNKLIEQGLCNGIIL